MSQSWRLGIDIGGTFTDFVLMNETTGEISIEKVPSTPASPAQAVINGTRALIERQSIGAKDIGYFVHGTTLAANTLIERKGARTGLLVTKGFRDVLNLGRLRLPNVYDLLAEKPEPLVPRKWVREVDERLRADGTIYQALDVESLLAEAAALVQDGAEAIAISLLHSYRNHVHERRAKEAIAKAFPQVYVCTSSEIWPQMREYERALVTVVNAYVGEQMANYFATLDKELRTLGLTASILSTKSNGGIMTAKSAGTAPVETLLSGPAAGVVGAWYMAKLAGFHQIVTLDMGGTSADVSVVDGVVPYSTENHVGDFPLIVPAVDVSSIGAGGGSIAWLDPAGILKVGPRSAGADPGPACYGLGGEDPTITDAYVVMGIIDPDKFLGGKIKLDRDLANKAISKVGKPLRLDPVGAAESIVRVATSNMYAELIALMAKKGVDISEFSLFVYGGAGPTHAFMLARETGIRRLLVPLAPGILCALGCLASDVKSDFIQTVYRTVNSRDGAQVMSDLVQRYKVLDDQALQWLRREEIPVQGAQLLGSIDMRYLGQSYEITVPMPREYVAPERINDFLRAFHERHYQVYGHSDERAPVEIINIRSTVVGLTPKPILAGPGSRKPGTSRALPSANRAVFFEGQPLEALVYQRGDLLGGDALQGPAIVEQQDTTVFIPPGFAASVDEFGNLIAEALS